MLLLVVGTGRCGSTLITELLARHPDVGFVSGVDDKLPRLNLLGGLPWSRRFEAGLRRHRLEPSRSTAYRSQLTHEQLRDIEQVAGPALERWGYLKTGPHCARDPRC